jgi:hypothetical protein
MQVIAPTFFFNEVKSRFFRLFFTLVIFLCFSSAYSQQKKLNPSTRNAYLRHLVLPHETFNSIGQLYGVSGEHLADYNNLEYYVDPVLARYLTIPLTRNNFSVEKKAYSNELLVPVYKLLGSTERIIKFKKVNDEPLRHAVVFRRNKIVSGVRGKLVLAGFLHTAKSNGRLFKTAEDVDLAKATKGATRANRDTTSTGSMTPDLTGLPSTKMADTVAATAEVPVEEAIAAAVLPNKSEKVFVDQNELVSRPISRVDKIYFLVKVQIILTAFLILLIFLYMLIKHRKQAYKTRLNATVRTLLINEILSEASLADGETSNTSDLEFLKKQLTKKANRQFVIDQIINGRKSIKGKVGESFLRLYVALGLQEDSCKKLKSKNWNEVAKGIQELAVMEQKQKMSDIFNEINSKNEFVRVEAQSALVYLSGFGGLWFLNVLNYPISEWQQMKLINMLTVSPITDVPELHVLLSSPQDSLVIFTLKLVGVLQQRTMHNAVVKCLGNKNEAVRFVAIKCLSEISNQYTAQVLTRRFSAETRRNKIAIVHALGEIGDRDQTDFLLDVLSEKDDTLKISAARALSKLGLQGDQLLEEYCTAHGGPYAQIFLHIKSTV